MLCQLTIKNIALIDALTIEFTDGLNVLTGETGAGKSIVIDAMNLALGERADRDLIRSGQERASVEALFDVSACPSVAPLLEENGIETEGGQLIVSRVLTLSGRNIVRINGTLVPLSLLKQVTSALVDVHGQHEHQYLMDEGRHLGFLDGFARHEVGEVAAVVAEKFQQYHAIKLRLRGIRQNSQERVQRVDMLRYQIDEIAQAKLKQGEEDELLEQRNLIRNAEKILSALSQCSAYLDGYEEMPACTDSIRQAVSLLSGISGYGAQFETLEEQLRDVYYTLEDIAMQVHVQAEKMDFDPAVADAVESRLDEIKSLKRKYGNTIEDVLRYQQDAQKELDQLTRQEKDSSQLDQQFARLSKELYEACTRLHDLRKQAAERFCAAVEEQLRDLGMAKARLHVDFAALLPFDQAEKYYSASGLDRVRFMISTNAGEPLKPLARTASGGELSRIMLAFKTIAAGIDDVGTMVFDEIDTGISGHMAQVVGEKMAAIGRSRQVICVTHLPQIAALGDSQHLVEKYEEEERTLTHVRSLSFEERVMELARMVGGAAQTEATLQHAREMLKLAAQLRNDSITKN